MSVLTNVVKVTNQFAYANSTLGINNVECQTSEQFIYDGKVYPIYEQWLYVPALPNNTTLSVPHTITDFPTNPILPVEVTGTVHVTPLVPGSPYKNIDNYPSAEIDYSVDSGQLLIITTVNMSPDAAHFRIRYVKQNGFTLIANN